MITSEIGFLNEKLLGTVYPLTTLVTSFPTLNPETVIVQKKLVSSQGIQAKSLGFFMFASSYPPSSIKLSRPE
jgi:hypothetical protein